ncbi:MAG: type I-E CRISPR-associated protein Cas6/Cse3/CasE [Microthrixaceae bacterium]|nr:type I-E CRISPR-associated protein Cas6/Cse3/CasE [Microthrixaceae bacterium]
MTTATLTRIRVNPRHRDARRDLANAVELHRSIMGLFDDTGGDARQRFGVLYRLDNDPSGPTLLVQSRARPDIEKLPTGYGEAATVDLARLLDHLDFCGSVRYRLLLNATKKPAQGPHKGKRIALGRGDTAQWWRARANTIGLQLVSEPIMTATLVTGRDPHDGRITVRAWRLDGAAVVQQPQPLREALLDGVGRAKAYGCGLLSLAPQA